MSALTEKYAEFKFVFTNLMSYACARMLSISYGYSPLKIGFVFLSFGIGECLLILDLQVD